MAASMSVGDKTPNGTLDEYDYYTCAEMLEYLGDYKANRHPDGHDSSQQISGHRDDFTGCHTYDNALDLLRTGWADGREQMGAMAAAYPPRSSAVQAVDLDVAGYRPDIALYLAGEPACMQTSIETRSSPFVSIAMNIVVSASTPPAWVMNYGIGLASMIHGFETSGYSVEAIATMSTGNGSSVNRMDLEIKQAGQRLDTDRLAFICGHPAMTRRLYFGWLECKTAGHKYGAGYGSICESEHPDADITVPSIIQHPEVAETLATSIEYFETLAKSQQTGER